MRHYKISYARLSKDEGEILRAGSAVQQQKVRGLMKPATAYPCVNCQKPAVDYHHASYRPDDRLCVVPLCGSCHMRVHKSGLQLPALGVVPTQVGVVRIAIATPTV